MKRLRPALPCLLVLCSAVALAGCTVKVAYRKAPPRAPAAVAAPGHAAPAPHAPRHPKRAKATPPGQTLNGNTAAPGHGGTPPGQMKRVRTTPPGLDGTAPGKAVNGDAVPPGHGGEAPGQGKNKAADKAKQGKPAAVTDRQPDNNASRKSPPTQVQKPASGAKTAKPQANKEPTNAGGQTAAPAKKPDKGAKDVKPQAKKQPAGAGGQDSKPAKKPDRKAEAAPLDATAKGPKDRKPTL